MEKRHIHIQKKLVDYLCKICKRKVHVALAKEWLIETDKSIIHTWNYGHQHNRKFEMLNGEQFQVEDSVDYE